jgi:hypothetical protein
VYSNFLKSTKRLAARTALTAIAVFSPPASAFQPLITDDTGTQGSGGNQLEFSLNADRAEVGDDVERVRTWPIVYTRGLSDTLDVFAGLSYVRIRPGSPAGGASGSGNPSFGAKWRFYENEKSRTSFALKPELLLPVSASSENAGLGNGGASGNLTFILTQEIPFGAIHVNAGLGRERYRDALNGGDATTARASIAPVWDLTEQWKLALDLGTESARAAGVSVRSNFIELGAIYSPGKDLDFALGILRTSEHGDPDTKTLGATAGLTWRFR